MQFVRVTSLEDAVAPLADRLNRELTLHEHVLWLVTGGSSIVVSVKVMELIPDKLSGRLAIYLTDERFGPIGHPDSNIQQLVNAGFNPKEATVVPVLVPAVALEDTVTRYEDAIKTGFDEADIIIGQFGIGPDGHISGILPGSDAVTSIRLVDGYTTETYTRITTTFPALKRVDVAFAFAFGDSKLAALTKLRDKDLSLSEEPSQILKQIPECYIYSDQIDSANTGTEPKGQG
jgi:6-phosphogluconolactonase/glucosamine-6-phosphate isomerase/deaminase